MASMPSRPIQPPSTRNYPEPGALNLVYDPDPGAHHEPVDKLLIIQGIRLVPNLNIHNNNTP